MRRNRKWKYATIALAGLLAMTVASPAIGGPSLKKLVKKEVSKQIAKASGPQGPAGPQGVQGVQGAQGQTGPAGAPLRAIALVGAFNPTPSFLPEIPEVGFESVSREEAGVYCIVPSPGIDPSSDPPLITFEYSNSAGEDFTAMWDRTSDLCGAGAYEIKIYEGDTALAADNTAFTILIP